MDLLPATWRNGILVTVILLSITSVFTRKATGKVAARYAFEVVSFDPCSGVLSGIKSFNFSQLMSSDGRTLVTGFGVFSRSAQRLTDIRGVAHKCRDAVSANTCEYYTKYVQNGDTCALITSPLMPWAGFVDKFQPSLKCPVQAGPVTISNATVDVDGIARMFGVSPNNDVWKFLITVKDEKHAMFICLDVAVRIVKYASRG